ncbi:MAG TPA: excinuclease ABC subunit C [Elusimicrobia bacterium]|nr:excinuclease ABC subunit C [Elusimicrobiota bacterium]HBT62329.1 excinuclease ABC subunit C [Elusimicrobiota bacterium]
MPSGPDRSHVPHACGVYLMRDAAGTILYIGKANDLFRRVAQYFNPRKPDLKNTWLAPLARTIDYVVCASEREALLLERRLIGEHQPFFNAMWKDDKSYPYVKITLGEDFPRILLTRRKLKDKSLYFGPYPKVAPIKGLLDHLWRQKLFPLRPCRWNFSLAAPLDPRTIRSCLYYHTRECPAPCAGRVSWRDYRRIARNAALFFSGKRGDLRRIFESQMREASARLEFERAARLRDNLAALDQMAQRVRLRAVAAGDIAGPVSASRAVTDLQQALRLPAPPHHVECFDVSHFQGRELVAAMACFQGGEPHKDHYRRFRLREVSGIDDFRSIAEAVRRRYGRMLREGDALPDLILIDGGKGQLGAALRELKALELRVPLAALAKRLEEIFLPGQPDSLILERGRPALRLLQRLRDEAHRFGVSYHRLLRGKALLP